MWLGCRVRHIFKAHSAEMAALLLIHSHRHRREDLGGGWFGRRCTIKAQCIK